MFYAKPPTEFSLKGARLVSASVARNRSRHSVVFYLAFHELFGAVLRFHAGHRFERYPFTETVLNHLKITVALGVREIGYEIHRDLLKELVGYW